jgi:hypothetical protein
MWYRSHFYVYLGTVFLLTKFGTVYEGKSLTILHENIPLNHISHPAKDRRILIICVLINIEGGTI